MILKMFVAVVKYALLCGLLILLCITYYCGTQSQRGIITLSVLTGGLIVDLLWESIERDRERERRKRRRRRHSHPHEQEV